MFHFYLYLRKWSNLTNAFQLGWNHQIGHICEVSQFESLLPPSSMWKKHVSDTIFGSGKVMRSKWMVFLGVGGWGWSSRIWLNLLKRILAKAFWCCHQKLRSLPFEFVCILFACSIQHSIELPSKVLPPFVSIHFLLIHVECIIIFVTWKHHLRQHTAFILLAWGLGGSGVQFCAGHQREGMKPSVVVVTCHVMDMLMFVKDFASTCHGWNNHFSCGCNTFSALYIYMCICVHICLHTCV